MEKALEEHYYIQNRITSNGNKVLWMNKLVFFSENEKFCNFLIIYRIIEKYPQNNITKLYIDKLLVPLRTP